MKLSAANPSAPPQVLLPPGWRAGGRVKLHGLVENKLFNGRRPPPPALCPRRPSW